MTRLHLPPGRTSIETVSSGTSSVGPPYQSAKRSGSVHSRQTSSRGASKVLTSSMSGPPLPAVASATRRLPSGAKPLLHPVEAALPEAAVVIDPLGDLPER